MCKRMASCIIYTCTTLFISFSICVGIKTWRLQVARLRSYPLPLSERWGPGMDTGFNSIESDKDVGTYNDIKNVLKEHVRKGPDDVPCLTSAFEWDKFLLIQSWYGRQDGNSYRVRIRVYREADNKDFTFTTLTCQNLDIASMCYELGYGGICYLKIFDALYYKVTSFDMKRQGNKLTFSIKGFFYDETGIVSTLVLPNQ